ncbi:MAG: M14 family metallopeptidase [Candidatus Aminicenantes bacterium]
MIKRNSLLVLIMLLMTTVLVCVETPEQFLGFKPGTDRELAHYNKIKAYFIKVGSESPRVNTYLIGKTTLNNDMVMAVISSQENMKHLEEYKAVSRKLSLAKVEEKEARELAAKGKAIVFITCNLHSNEIASSQMALELLYKMATENSPDTKKILDNVIFVFIPSANPDGQIMVVEWYYKHKGTKYEGSFLPYLYHWYAGHDNNRDWFKINLKETWLITQQLYFEWFPQVSVDEHQMGSSGDRFYIPPFAEPPTPGVHPLVWRAINFFGTRIAYDLEKLDYRGVASRGFFMGWWIGALDDSAWFHNIPGILFEAASVRHASPIYIEPEEVSSGTNRQNEERMFSPSPWTGGWWRLGDIVNYDFHATLSVLSTAATYPEELLFNSYKMAKDNIKRGKTEPPFAYVVPKNQWDPMTAEKYIKTLRKSNIKIYQLTSPLQVENHYFPTGSYVVPLAQPYRSFAKNILERQHYPDLREAPGESFTFPYDGAGWTLHLAMGVDALEIKKPFKAEMKTVELEDVYKRNLPENLDEYIVLDARYNNSYLAASRLLKKNIDVWRDLNGAAGAKGSFIVKKSTALVILEEINRTMPLILFSRPDLPLEKLEKLKSFKVALYQNWGHNMEEGWTRYVFDEFKINYETVHHKDVLKKDFLKKYDIVVFVGAGKTEIQSGKPPKKWERWYTPLPPEYSGGIGEKGKKVLKEFLKKGKTLIFMGDSCAYALEHFKLPVENIIKEAKKVRCPGSYLQVEVKESDLTYGMKPKAAIYYSKNPVFSTFLPRSITQKRRTPVTFGRRDLLLSGYLKGEKSLLRNSLVVDFFIDNGRVILIGPIVTYRAQSEGIYKIMFNALFTAAVSR